MCDSSLNREVFINIGLKEHAHLPSALNYQDILGIVLAQVDLQHLKDRKEIDSRVVFVPIYLDNLDIKFESFIQLIHNQYAKEIAAEVKSSVKGVVVTPKQSIDNLDNVLMNMM